MTRLKKTLAGATAAFAMTLTAAAPAQAQYYQRDHYQRDRGGIDLGDVVAGVAIVGGIAALASSLGSNNRSYGYAGYGQSGYGYNQSGPINACGAQAQRYGRVSITDVDQRNRNSYRVRGVIDQAGYGWNNRGVQRAGFTCTARIDGRINNFRIDNGRYW